MFSAIKICGHSWKKSVSLCVLLALIVGAQRLSAQTENPGITYYADHVLPILATHCVDCHGPDTAESHLRLDSMVAALRGGDSGEPTITPGRSSLSHLIERVSTTDSKLRMPPGEHAALSESQIDSLKRWIDNEQLWEEAKTQVGRKELKHWAFQPIGEVALPTSHRSHPIDRFIEHRLFAEQLQFSPAAEKSRLIRRLYLVMHGLLPTPDQVAEFVNDSRPQAWDELVHRVLESPRYGERIATLWLDLVHFGETNGFETNRERPTAYFYRDWVIAAFNDDKPYDQFVRQQIAGDALGEPIGTGFLVAGPNDIVKGQDPLLGLMQRQDELTDIVNTTGTAFLGLTTGCARCHNHKFDPISQSDFYAMQAVFAGVEHGEQQLPLSVEAEARLSQLDEQIAIHRSNLQKYVPEGATREPVNPRQNTERFAPTEVRFVRFKILATNASEPCIDELQIFSEDTNVALASSGAIATSSGDFEHPLHQLKHINDGLFGNARSWIAKTMENAWIQIALPDVKSIDRIVWQRDREGVFSDRLATHYEILGSRDGETWFVLCSSSDRIPFGKDEQSSYDFSRLSEEDAKQARLELQSLKAAQKQKSALLASTKAYVGSFKQPPEVFRLFRGDPQSPREVVPPGGISALQELAISTSAAESTRRLQLADWIASPQNPLTARVMVNRIWQFHFGIGLVDTPSDFGANGSAPTHPELLDWLADYFIDHGWSIKQLHRLILTSDTWKQDSRPSDAGMARDAQSRLLWRFPPRRLEAEAIRDCMLQVTGRLDLSLGGPGFSGFEVELENVRHYFPKSDYGPTDWRRMIYMNKVRMEKDSVFGVFDCPDASQVMPKRSRSTTPLQALNLLNSRFVLQQSDFFAERLKMESQDVAQRIQRAYWLVFGRSPEPDETEMAKDFCHQFGWESFARAMLNANEFVFIP